MKNVLPKIIVLIVALGALMALIFVMLRNKEKVKETGKKVASKLNRKKSEGDVEDIDLECCEACDACDAWEASDECDACDASDECDAGDASDAECETCECEAAEEAACDCCDAE